MAFDEDHSWDELLDELLCEVWSEDPELFPFERPEPTLTELVEGHPELDRSYERPLLALLWAETIAAVERLRHGEGFTTEEVAGAVELAVAERGLAVIRLAHLVDLVLGFLRSAGSLGVEGCSSHLPSVEQILWRTLARHLGAAPGRLTTAAMVLIEHFERGPDISTERIVLELLEVEPFSEASLEAVEAAVLATFDLFVEKKLIRLS